VRFRDARRLHQIAWDWREAGRLELVDFGRKSAEQIFIFSANSSETTFTTNSLTASICAACLYARRPSRESWTEADDRRVGADAGKKLNGARLRMPSGLMVETKAMGRGTITPTISL